MPKILIIAVPAWLAAAAPTSGLSSAEVCEVFGYKLAGLRTAVRDGRFPAPDWRTGGVHKLRWHARTVRNEVRRRNPIT